MQHSAEESRRKRDIINRHVTAMWLSRLPALLSVCLCAGCCFSNCSIDDLQFVSLEPRSQIDARASNRKLYPLELQFSTAKNLIDLQDHNDISQVSIRIYVCDHGPDQLVDSTDSIHFNGSYVLPTKKYSYDGNIHMANERYDPGLDYNKGPPLLHEGPDGRITYQALIGIRSERIDVQLPYGGRTFVERPLPQPLPKLCLQLLITGFFPGQRSNVVHIPAEAAETAFLSQSIISRSLPVTPAILQQIEDDKVSERHQPKLR